ncbi:MULTISPECIES: ABC transporter ATP-binding protein [Butyricimonas]|uniref:ABC transporter ATP-binding protein n=1 Tax=Butyricimonas TaxID=574697 RepID=UPI00036AEE19|nr:MULTISPECIES: ABC transporter ATP-binding protein [Butyricimonas]
MNKSIVKVEHLSHRYSVQWAVSDISFEIPCKGIYGLLGSNGAGKSTVMNILCGVLKQTQGNAFINGINTKENTIEAKKFIGFLPQKPPLYNDLTVEEYLSYTAELRHMPDNEIAAAVGEVLELCAISHFRKRLVKNLSGGYQQRVGIAQAIIHKPQLVVFDEPTNGLDPNQIIEIRELIRGIAKERTVILSTHILSEVQAICDHILMIEQGKLVFSGTVEEFDNYIVPNTIYVSLADAPSVDVLSQVEGITQVEELGGPNFRIHFTDVDLAMDRLVEQSAVNHWKMVEIRLEKSSLDTIFAELSKKK